MSNTLFFFQQDTLSYDIVTIYEKKSSQDYHGNEEEKLLSSTHISYGSSCDFINHEELHCLNCFEDMFLTELLFSLLSIGARTSQVP